MYAATAAKTATAETISAFAADVSVLTAVSEPLTDSESATATMRAKITTNFIPTEN